MSLEALYKAIDRLNPDELARLQQYIAKRQNAAPQQQDAEQHMVFLSAALEEIPPDMTEDEISAWIETIKRD